jgi:hypothetical protein
MKKSSKIGKLYSIGEEHYSRDPFEEEKRISHYLP